MNKKIILGLLAAGVVAAVVANNRKDGAASLPGAGAGGSTAPPEDGRPHAANWLSDAEAAMYMQRNPGVAQWAAADPNPVEAAKMHWYYVGYNEGRGYLSTSPIM